VSHVVVQEQWPSRTERVVPVDWVGTTTRDIIVLKEMRDQFSQLDPFVQTEFVYTDVPHFATDPKLTMIWPYAVSAKRVVDEQLRQVPPGELAVRRGARVVASDGRCGRVDEFVVNPDSGHITHLVLREGHLWGQRDITIPIGEIDRIEEGRVYLKLDKEGIAALPSVPVRRRW
jgi:hypothetical protein